MMADLKSDWYFNLLSEMVTCAQDSSNVNFQSKATVTYLWPNNLVDFRDGTRGVQKQPIGSGTAAQVWLEFKPDQLPREMKCLAIYNLQTFPSRMEVRLNELTSTTKSRPLVTNWSAHRTTSSERARNNN